MTSKPTYRFWKEGHCPFCDATPKQVEDSIRAFGFFGSKFCEYCGLRQASLPFDHHPPPRSRRL